MIIDIIRTLKSGSHAEIYIGSLQGKKYDVIDKGLEVRWG